MPRGPRIELAGGVHHLTSRGNRRQRVFRCDTDRELFLRELAHSTHLHEWRCLAYCLMENHFHVVLETLEPNLGLGMRRFLSRFVQLTNDRHGLSGRMFEQRYGSVLVTSDRHFVCLMRYVALNPVTAGLCRDPIDWPWSSHRATLARRTNGLVAVRRVNELLAPWGGEPNSRYATLFDPDGPHGSWSNATDPYPPRPTLDELASAVGPDRAMKLARWQHDYRVREIAAYFGCSEATVSRRTRTDRQ